MSGRAAGERGSGSGSGHGAGELRSQPGRGRERGRILAAEQAGDVATGVDQRSQSESSGGLRGSRKSWRKPGPRTGRLEPAGVPPGQNSQPRSQRPARRAGAVRRVQAACLQPLAIRGQCPTRSDLLLPQSAQHTRPPLAAERKSPSAYRVYPISPDTSGGLDSGWPAFQKLSILLLRTRMRKLDSARKMRHITYGTPLNLLAFDVFTGLSATRRATD